MGYISFVKYYMAHKHKKKFHFVDIQENTN